MTTGSGKRSRRVIASAPARRPGRPRIHDAPRRDVFLRLPDALVSEMDAAAGEGHRTTWVEAAVREKLARDV